MAGVFYQYVGIKALDIKPFLEEPVECVLSIAEWNNYLGEEKTSELKEKGDLVRVIPCRMDMKTGNFVEVKSVSPCNTMEEVNALNEKDEFGWMIM